MFIADSIHCVFMDNEDHHCAAKNEEKPACNQTTKCEAGNGCYALWKNSSGEIVFKKKGCWPRKSCLARSENQKECVGHYNIQNDLYFCCCFGHLCNANISNITMIRREAPGI